MPLLEIRDLTLEFVSGNSRLRALEGVSLTLERGESLCLVGESGSGKSVTGLSIARLLPSPPAVYAGGEIRLAGRNVLGMTPAELRGIRGRVVSYIFQNPGASLNPVRRVGTQIREALRLHRPQHNTDEEVSRLLHAVRIPDPDRLRHAYPFQLSGGMQQRVMIALAIAPEPALLVADEPTTALDMTIQAQILELLGDLRKRLNVALLLITHHLGIVSEMADRVAVMYAGQIVESGPARALLDGPAHPYTRALLDSVPRLGSKAAHLSAIPGSVPAPGNFPPGCRFAPRCPIARPECGAAPPLLEDIGAGRTVRCPFWQTVRPPRNPAPHTRHGAA